MSHVKDLLFRLKNEVSEDSYHEWMYEWVDRWKEMHGEDRHRDGWMSACMCGWMKMRK